MPVFLASLALIGPLLGAGVATASVTSVNLVSVSSAEVLGNGESMEPAMSSDGRYVAFSSLATNLAPGDDNGHRDVFWRDTQAGTTRIVSRDAVDADSASTQPSVSDDGRYVLSSRVPRTSFRATATVLSTRS